MSHANFRSKRVFGQPHKIFRETNLYLQLMCLETDKVRAWRAFALLKGNLWTGLWQKCTFSPALLRLDALSRKPVHPGLCERCISHSSVAGGLWGSVMKGSRALLLSHFPACRAACRQSGHDCSWGWVFCSPPPVPFTVSMTVTSIRLLPRMSAELTAEPKSWPHPQPANQRGAGGGRYHLSVTTCPGCSGGSAAKRWPWSPCVAITYPEISNSASKVSGKFRNPSHRGGGWIKDGGCVQYEWLP